MFATVNVRYLEGEAHLNRMAEALGMHVSS